MFLNQLSEKEKSAFVSLSIYAAKANGVVDTDEQMMIQEYCREMEMPFFDAESKISMDEVVSIFIDSDIRIKKIVLLETLGLLYSDGSFDDSEKGFVNKYAKKIGLSDEDVEKQIKALKCYFEALEKIAEVIA